MNPDVEKHILQATKAKKITGTERIQKLWNDYGDLLRIHLDNDSSVILKHIQVPENSSHPKGFNNDLSRQRKVKSYQVETSWYEVYNGINLKDQSSPTAALLKGFQGDGEVFILLEDLDNLGFNKRLSKAGFDEIKVVLEWLASFHAKFLQVAPKNLWSTGTYWHLDTRPDELSALNDSLLKVTAPLMDQRLKSATYQTIVHGDAKLANFCFNADSSKVAAVDFQYVGGGCGMKDVAYFIGSCLDEGQCEGYEREILDHYFSKLLEKVEDSTIDKSALESEWRGLFHVAWADFHRFLKGWSPSHWKINTYSERVSKNVAESLLDELLATAKEACLQAGTLVMSHWQQDIKVSSKNGSSESSRIVTEVDHLSQNKILSQLQPSIERYDLGLLAEETKDDRSRLLKDFFWAVDPLDGTLFFSEGKEGFAITVALVDQLGQPVIGVVYDPVGRNLFHAIRNGGSFQNGIPLSPIQEESLKFPKPLFADRSIRQSPNFSALAKNFEVQFTGGAVMNSIHALLHRGCYFKYPKEETGGCAIWDLAAASLILEEAGGTMTGFDGAPLFLNKPDSLYYNQEGLFICGNKDDKNNFRVLL